MTIQEWRNVPESQRRIIGTCFRLGVDFLWRGPSELLVSQAGTERLVEALTKEGATVLGLEAFNIDGDNVHPRMDLIYDSDRAPSDLSAGTVVALWPSEVWIEVVLGDQPSEGKGG